MRGDTVLFMTDRRTFFQSAAGVALAAGPAQSAPEENDRAYWLRTLTRLADPVPHNLAAGTLKRNMPVECAMGNSAERAKFTHLEALGRLLTGIAPWLEATLSLGAEHDQQQRYRDLARQSIRSACDPQSPDFLNFHDGAQALVDCGFLSQAILRAPNELWKKLDAATQKNLAVALASSRGITPGFNNWLLFSANVEAALLNSRVNMPRSMSGSAWALPVRWFQLVPNVRLDRLSGLRSKRVQKRSSRLPPICWLASMAHFPSSPLPSLILLTGDFFPATRAGHRS